MQPETRFKIRFRKRLDKIPNSKWEKISQRSVCGVPDMFGCIRGHTVVLELKTDTGRATKLQERNLFKWKKAGAFVAIVCPLNEDEIIKQLEAL